MLKPVLELISLRGVLWCNLECPHFTIMCIVLNCLKQCLIWCQRIILATQAFSFSCVVMVVYVLLRHVMSAVWSHQLHYNEAGLCADAVVMTPIGLAHPQLQTTLQSQQVQQQQTQQAMVSKAVSVVSMDVMEQKQWWHLEEVCCCCSISQLNTLV